MMRANLVVLLLASWSHAAEPQIRMGHSAGTHLAGLVCTDDRYLKAEGLSLSIIKG